MPIHIANFYDADRRTAVCAQTGGLTMGMLIKVSDDGAGGRKALQVQDADTALLVAGNYGIAYKVVADAFQVNSSTANATLTGSRIVTIASGDNIVEVRRGAIVEYSADLLHSSLDPARSGALPVVGAALAIKSGQWCTTGTGGAITSPVCGRVYQVNSSANKVLVEIV